MTNTTISAATTANAASQLLEGAQSVSTIVYCLPNEDYTVTHGLTSQGTPRIILKSADDESKGTINLFHNVDPEVLNELIPEDLYEAGQLNILFQPSASAGSETVYNFQFYPNQNVANKLLARKGHVAQAMVFPTKKEQLNGAEASFATSINRGNKGRAAVEASKVFKKEGAIAGFFKGLLN